MKVAACQIRVTDNAEENCRRIIKFLERAKRRKADIACFPETCMIANIRDMKPVEIFVERIKNKCREMGIYCIFGTYAREGKKTYNAVYVINRRGRIIHTYRKMHLWNSERGITAGRKNTVIETEFGKIGVITCWDFAFPEDIRKLSRAGALVIFCPSYLVSYKPALHVLESLPITRAFENMCYYVTCDAFTKETACMSFISSPYKILAKIKGKEGIISRKINLKRIEKLRKFYNHV